MSAGLLRRAAAVVNDVVAMASSLKVLITVED
jgi:hypothetical protein